MTKNTISINEYLDWFDIDKLGLINEDPNEFVKEYRERIIAQVIHMIYFKDSYMPKWIRLLYTKDIEDDYIRSLLNEIFEETGE